MVDYHSVLGVIRRFSFGMGSAPGRRDRLMNWMGWWMRVGLPVLAGSSGMPSGGLLGCLESAKPSRLHHRHGATRDAVSSQRDKHRGGEFWRFDIRIRKRSECQETVSSISSRKGSRGGATISDR
jgi:hypothetical protein